MKFPIYNHHELEPEILAYWQTNRIVKKLREKNKNGEKFYFLQGPPYTSGKVHLGTAWNTALKDISLRYKRSRGCHVWDRNGFDVHGLPTAHKVMAKHDLKTKEDIETYGVDKFMKECKTFCLDMAKQMEQDFLRVGVTLDYSDSYMALTNEYMEGEWWLVKKAWEKNRLYQGEKVMTWCGNCETALAKHECEYENVTDTSIYVKFPMVGKENEYLVIWTTTPWTIPFNLAVMVGPEIDYLKVDVGGESWILARELAAQVVESLGKKMKVVEEFKGKTMDGWEYFHPFAEKIGKYKELKKNHPRVHTVILSDEYVDTSAGTGLVHTSPGSGPEDQEACQPYDIPPFNNLTQEGIFQESTPQFAGLKAKQDDEKIIDALEKTGALVHSVKYQHDYPHCWRCHKPVLFRLTKQWFFKIEDLRNQMIEADKKVAWQPQTNAFTSWTTHLRDNSITRQRYWGTAVPIWKCSKCAHIHVIGSSQELQDKAGSVPEDLHRPWIDKVHWRCEKCTLGTMQRIPDILDVWIDAGTASWNCLYYPKKQEYFTNFFPANLIVEATEQVRLWFSMLSICSQLALGKNCYTNVYMHGMIRDVDGVKMSKSLGNIITPDEMVDKHGADVLRYYMCQNNAGQDVRFSWDEAALKGRHLKILWNVHKLLLNLMQETGINPTKVDIPEEKLAMAEQYMFSKLHSTMQQVTELFDTYHLDETVVPLEDLFLELSRTYIQMVRDKSALGSKEEKEVVVYTLYTVLLEFLKMFSILCPFICEAIFLNLKDALHLPEESISHYPWPTVNKEIIDTHLEQEMSNAKNLIQGILFAREKAQLGVRWPVKEVVVIGKELSSDMQEVIKKQTNVKTLTFTESLPGVKLSVKPDYAKIGPAFGKLSPQVIAKITEEDINTLIEHINAGGYEFLLDKTSVKVTKDMLIIEQQAPDGFIGVESKSGWIYLNTERSTELDGEGLARELMRKVQDFRKKVGLQKPDRVLLFVKVNGHQNKLLHAHQQEMQEKVGAKVLKISLQDPLRRHQHEVQVTIKDQKISVWLSRVG